MPTISGTFTVDAGIVLEAVDLDADGLIDFVFRSDFIADELKSFVLLNRHDTWIPSLLSTTSGTIATENLDGDDTFEVYVFDDPIRIFRYQDDAFLPWGEIPKGTSRASILDFNRHMKNNITGLESRGEKSDYLIVNLFCGYLAATNNKVTQYIERLQERYKEGETVEYAILMKG